MVVIVFNFMIFVLKVILFLVKFFLEVFVVVDRFKSLFLMEEVYMIKNKLVSFYIKIEMKNVILVWDFFYFSIQNLFKLIFKMKKDKRVFRGKKEKVRQLQCIEYQVVLVEQKGYFFLDSDEWFSFEEEEGKYIYLGYLCLQRMLYSIDLEI